jgi:hypothetical protein
MKLLNDHVDEDQLTIILQGQISQHYPKMNSCTFQGTKAAKPTKPAASDLPVPAEGVRNIKSLWEKGNVFSSPTASGTPNKVSMWFVSFNFRGVDFFFPFCFRTHPHS